MVAAFPTVVSGTVITATWGNTVRDGLVNVFASSSARTSAIVSPEEGMFTFLKGGDTFEYYDGSNWLELLRFAPKTIAQSASIPLTSNTIQQSTDLTLAMAASAQYVFKALIFFTANEGGDIAVGMTVPSGASWRAGTRGIPFNIASPGSANFVFYSAAAAASPLATFSGENGGAVMTCEIEGQMNTSSAGNLAITFAQGTGNANATTFLSKSFLTIQRFG